MLWLIALIVILGAGLPLGAWLATRGLARRPSSPLKPYYSRQERWMMQRYGLTGKDSRLVSAAVTSGGKVVAPELEPAAHAFATDGLARRVLPVRLLSVVSKVNIVLGVAMAAFGVVGLSLGQISLNALWMIIEGAFFTGLGCLQARQFAVTWRRNPARALNANRPAPS